MAKVALAQYEA